MPEKIKICAASRTHVSDWRTVECVGARLVCSRVQRNANVNHLPIGKRIDQERVGCTGISFVVGPDFVEAEVCSRQQAKVQAHPVSVHSSLPVLKKKLFSALVNRGKRGAFVDVP